VPAPRKVIVLGRGIVGCAIGYELARRGAAVVMADDREPGMGATQASAGMLAPYNEVEETGPHLDLIVQALGRYDGFVARVSKDSGETIEYQRSGTLSVALSEDGLKHLQAIALTLARTGVSAEWLDAAALRREEPAASPDLVGGLLIPAHGYVVASALTHALAVAAQRFGARLLECPRAVRIRRSGDEVVVENGGHSLTADHVVVAAGSWAGQIEIEGAERRLPIHPVRGQLLHLKWPGTNLRRVTWAENCYLVPWADGSLLVGATVENVGFDEHTTVAGIFKLLAALCEVLPGARAAHFVAARAGLRPASPDGLPVIGSSIALPGVTYASGHYRNGLLLAPITAELVADLVLDGRVDPLLTVTNPARFGRM
jgi:glycine oxidase